MALINRFIDLLLSVRTMALLLLVFAISIGVATFIENDFGTQAAKAVVYNAIWFDILLILLAVNLLNNIGRYNLLRKSKIPVLTFHVAFLVILLGAGITRFFGYEGAMPIREGETSNVTISSDTYLQVKVDDRNMQYSFARKLLLSELGTDKFNEEFDFEGNKISISYEDFIPDASDGRRDVLVANVTVNEAEEQVKLWGGKGFVGKQEQFTLDGVNFTLAYGSQMVELPFSLRLDDFVLDKYPGSMSASSYSAFVTVRDEEKTQEYPYKIFMNNVLYHRGYRFYQSSYDSDEKGTILSVNRDFAGTVVTYIGYFLLTLGSVLTIIGKKTRLSHLRENIKKLNVKKSALTLLVPFLVLSSFGYDSSRDSLPARSVIEYRHAENFGKLLTQDKGGRIKPVHTVASEVLRKVSRKVEFNGLSPLQVFLGMIHNPYHWRTVEIIKVGQKDIQKMVGSDGKYASFLQFFTKDGSYVIADEVEKAFRKKPANRGIYEKELIAVDERVNICMMTFSTSLLRIIPVPRDSDKTWYSPAEVGFFVHGEDSTYISRIFPLYYSSLTKAVESGNWEQADETLTLLKLYQERVDGDIFPSERKLSLEILNNKLTLFKRLFTYYSLIGLLLLILFFIKVFNPARSFRIAGMILTGLLILGFAVHTAGLGLRWYISGHEPWSNAYESMIFIAWSTILAGLIFSRQAKVSLAVTSILASLILMVAHLNWMDPEITNLVPVLNSYWLMIHVAVITSSYGFFGLGCLLGLLGLILMVFFSSSNKERLELTIKELKCINEMTLTVGLFLMAIGTFLGGVWANESWGRYWGWDAKETWALVTVLVYAFIAHMRLVPILKGVYAYNLASVFGFGSVLMTYFGVNYYLSGLHSYAAGDPAPVPTYVYYTVISIAVLAGVAYMGARKSGKANMVI